MSEPIPEKSKERLKNIAQGVIEPEDAYTKDQIVERIMRKTGVTLERAENGFKMMLESGAIEDTQSGKFYLGGSTPF